MIERYDVVVIGSGVAGATAALACSAAGRARVVLVTKAMLGDSTTRLSQGGIAVADGGNDDPDLHLSDTLRAGAGLCDEQATRVLVESAGGALEELVSLGARFDRGGVGELLRSKEGGHSVARVVHAGGAATGAEVVRTLTAALQSSDVTLRDNTFATDLLFSEQGCLEGVVGFGANGAEIRLLAPVVVLATGGAGQLFEVTTNPASSTGDGLAMALRAGAVVADVEFVQFHPTALHVPRRPRPLLSEALRGEGAKLRNARGERFVDELAPRDVVSRAIAAEITASGVDHVQLDARAIAEFEIHFPSLRALLAQVDLDPAVDLLPVAPAAHYLCGGVLSDLDGATTIDGLFAVGEVACTGVEGANRLASNSLLEGLVFGGRAARAILSGRRRAELTGAMRGLDHSAADAIPLRRIDVPTSPSATSPTTDVAALREELARTMTRDVGVVRDADGLERATALLAGASAALAAPRSADQATAELVNLVEVGSAVAAAALERRESRGAHTRSDYPERDDARFCCRMAIEPADRGSQVARRKVPT